MTAYIVGILGAYLNSIMADMPVKDYLTKI